jgi:hypothetical protein
MKGPNCDNSGPSKRKISKLFTSGSDLTEMRTGTGKP